jgi:hypothetical protein
VIFGGFLGGFWVIFGGSKGGPLGCGKTPENGVKNGPFFGERTFWGIFGVFLGYFWVFLGDFWIILSILVG